MLIAVCYNWILNYTRAHMPTFILNIKFTLRVVYMCINCMFTCNNLIEVSFQVNYHGFVKFILRINPVISL